MQGQNKNISKDTSYQQMDSLIESDHVLRKIDAEIDFSFVDIITEPFFSPNRGRESIPPQQYFKMLLIKHWYDISSINRLLDAIKYNIVYRWFCGFTLDEKLPDASSFTRLKKRFGVNAFELFFNNILQQCVEKGLVKSDSVMTDSTLFRANASMSSMLRVDGKRRIPGQEKFSNKTHKSITDPDATLAVKAGTARGLKYKAHVCSDSESRVVINIKITTGAVHDSIPFIKQIEEIQNYGLTVKEAIADSAYGTAENILKLREKSVSTNIPLFSSRSGSEASASGIEGFSYDEVNNQYICPNRKILKACNSKCDTVLYTSKMEDCRDCPLIKTCQAKKENGGPNRVVRRNKHAELFKEIRTQMEQDEFKQKMHQRMWKIEGILNELKNCHDLGRANYRGLDNVTIQGFMAAIAINIKRIIFFWFWILATSVLAN